MKTCMCAWRTVLGLSVLLSVLAASGIYLSINDASAADKRSTVKAKTARLRKPQRAVISMGARLQKQPRLIEMAEPLSPNLFALVNPTQEELDEEMHQLSVDGDEDDQEEFEEKLKRADEPDKAMEYYLRKRLPAGERDLPVERYFEALAEMQQMSLHSTADNRLFSRAELRRSDPAQQRLGTWTPLGPGNIGGRTRAILINPQDPNVMYAAAVAGGVWKSTNAGQAWSPLADLLANIAFCSLAFDPKDPSTIYAGTGEGFSNADGVRGAGIFKTTNAGVTWTRLLTTANNNANFFAVNKLVVSSNNSNRVYAATNTGVWRSTDAGETWTRVVIVNGGGGCHDLAARTDQTTDFLLAACGNLAQATVYRKTDAEVDGTWEAVLSETNMGRTAVAFAPSNQNIVYAVSAELTGAYQHGLHAFFRSNNGGANGSWVARVRNTDANKVNTAILSDPSSATAILCKFGTGDFFGGQAWYDLTIAVDPLDAERVWVGGTDVMRSDDGGANWGSAAFVYDATGGSFVYGRPHQLHPDQHFLIFHPQFNGTTNQQLFVGNDGGVWRSANARAAIATGSRAFCDSSANKVQWQAINNGYAVTQFYHGTVYPDGKSYFAGSQDNGTSRGSDAEGPNNWKMIFSADGGYSAIDFNNPNTLYASTQNGGFRKSTDNGATFSLATLGLAGAGLFITPLAQDPSDPQRLYTGGDQLFRTDRGMSFWTNLGSLRNLTGTTGTLSALAVAPTDANYALFGLNEGTIVRTTRALALSPTNLLSTTSERFTRPRAATLSWLAYDPNDKNIAYATYSTFGGAHVFRTTNGGDSWTNIDGTGSTAIPDIPVHCIVVDTSNTARLYVSTDLGVFVSIDGGATWAVENTGFANVVTESLALNVAGGVTTLYAFTHGRGAYKVTANMGGCNFALAQTGRTVAADGSDLTVDVTVAPGGCSWKVESNVPWITVQPGAGGTTNGTVGLKVEANRNIGRRFGTVAIAGRSFTVTQEGAPDLDAPTLRITTPNTPTVTTTGSTVTLLGTATDNSRVASVTWRSDRGFSGTATGTTSWAIASVPVLTGRNELTVRAADDAGNVSSASMLLVNSIATSVLTTVVGTGATIYNGENIPALLANITNPSGTIFFDGGGNFYFADFNLQRVRKVSSAGLITTLAGNGVAGFSGDGGKATDAQLTGPRGAAPDNQGNVYILDAGNQRIRRVNVSTGIITTFAGTGATGFGGDGGPATEARFDFGGIGALAFDASGNLFIADSNNNRIRRVAIDTGVITTVAGTGVAGFGGDGGPATAALLRSPQSLFFDRDGNLFFADNGNFRIRKIAAGSGTITTVAGTGATGTAGDGGPATNATIGSVFGIALDANNNLFLSDVTNNRVRRVAAADNVITLVAGGGATGFTLDGAAAIGASFSLARHLGVDPQGFLYIAESNNFRIRKLVNGVPNDTAPPTVAISEPTTSATFTATNAALDLRGTAADNGGVAIVRWSNDRGGSGAALGTNSWTVSGIGLQPGVNNLTITAWDVSGNTGSAQLAVSYTPQQVVTTIAGTGVIGDHGDGGPGTAADLFQPRGVALDSKGNIYVADTQNQRIRRVSPTGQITAFAGTGEIGSGGDGGPALNATFNFPNVVVVDKSDNVYISSQLTHRIRKVTPDGKISTIAGTGEGFGGFGGDGGLATAAQLNGPVGLALDNDGNLFIADRSNNRIRRIDARTGIITTVAGSGFVGGGGDGGPATQAELNVPTGVAVDGAGNLYITDIGNQRIRRVSAADGRISTLAGTGVAGFSGDGGSAASALINLAYPATLTLDAAGDLYFADRNNHRIRKITLGTGIITTVAGTGVTGFNGDGTAPAGTALSFPTSVAFDAAGNMLIADSSNNRVRRTRPASTLRTLASVSAASFSLTAGLAAEEIASAFGANLATTVEVASVLPLPTTLAGVTVRVRDNLGIERLAPLFFVSPGQINYLVPSGTANGITTVTATNAAGEISTGTVNISNVAPSLFAANANGSGVVAAVLFRRNAAGQDSFEQVARFDAATGRFVAVPIDLGPEGDLVFLIAYGTGFRGLSSLANVSATIGGANAPVLFAGAAPGLVGADQANLQIVRSLAGRGEVDVVLMVDGKTANTVRVTIK